MSASTTPKPKARQAGLLEPLPKGGEEGRPRVVTRVSAAEDGSSRPEGAGNLSLGVALTATCDGFVREASFGLWAERFVARGARERTLMKINF